MRRFVLLPLVSIGAASCQPAPPELTDAMKASIAAEVEATATEWWNAWAAVDYAGGMAFFEDSPDAAWTGDEGTLYTIDDMNAEWEGTWGVDLERQQIDFTDSRTVVLAPDVAYTIRQYDAVVTDTAGTQRPQVSGIETLVWVKRNGQWKVLLGHGATLRKSWQTILDRETN